MVWGPNAPDAMRHVPKPEWPRRVKLGTDECIIDGKQYFVRGCLDIPVHNETECFRWLVWVAVSKPELKVIRSFWRQLRNKPFPPTRGQLAVALPYEPGTIGLTVELTDAGPGDRPIAKVQDASHPLDREQHHGISLEDAYEKAGRMMHSWSAV